MSVEFVSSVTSDPREAAKFRIVMIRTIFVAILTECMLFISLCETFLSTVLFSVLAQLYTTYLPKQFIVLKCYYFLNIERLLCEF